jgi:segregation and condensation protein A
VIVRFLAVLELFKQGQIDLDQVDRCGEITITWCGDPDPDVAAMAVDVYEG